MSKNKRINIEGDKDFYTLLCNLGDKNESIVIEALESEKQRMGDSRELVLENIDNVDKELSFYKKNFAVFERESQHAIDVLFSLDNDYGLQEYFSLVGIDYNFLNDVRRIISEEANTGAKFKEIKEKINELISRKDKLKSEVEDLDGQLRDNKKRMDLTSSYTADLGALIEGSINENGTFNKDYVKGLLVPISEMATRYEFDLGDNFIDRASKAIFFPKDGLEDIYKKYVSGDVKFQLLGEDNNKKDIILDDINDLQTSEIKEEQEDLEQINEQEKTIDDGVEETSAEEVVDEQANDTEVNLDDSLLSVDSSLDDINISLPEDFVNEERNESEAEKVVEEEPSTEEESVTEEDSTIKEETVPEEEHVIEEISSEEPNKEKVVFEDIQNEANEEPDISDLLIAEVDSGNVSEIIRNCNLNENKINDELKELLKYSKENVVSVNYDTLRAINIDDDIIYYENNGYSYLTDSELVDKINFLRSKVISDKVIAIALKNHYIDISLDKMKHNIKVLEDNNIPFNKEFLAVMNYDLNNYVKAIASLADYGIEPDDVEKTQYLSILTKYSNNIIPNTEILKEYGVSLLRKNGKYALEIYSISPEVLQNNIDQILETGEVDLVETIPEVLAFNADTLVERINYLKDSSKDYKNGNAYSDVVYKPMAFHLQFGDNVVKKLVDLNDSNNQLSEEIGNDYCSVLIEILNKYYGDPSCYMHLELDQDEQTIVDNIKDKFETEFGAELVSKSLYKIDNNYISKYKFERNLNYLVSVLLKNGQEVENNYSEILLVSAYYNKRIEHGSNFELPNFVNNKN